MWKNRKYYAVMANRKMLWLVSVVIIAMGLIFNIILGVNADIRFTGGAMLRYSYPESGIVSAADVPAATVPVEVSDGDIDNTEPEPADTPVIISDSQVTEESVSDADVTQEVIGSDTAQPVVSDGQVSDSEISAGDVTSESDFPQTDAAPPTIQPDYSTNVDPAEAGRIISDALGEEVTVQISTDAVSPTGGENKRLIVTFNQDQHVDRDTDRMIRQAMEAKYPNVALTLRESNLVDPSVGGEFLSKCILAVSLAALVVIIYMGLRYRGIGGWSAGVCAFAAILHDCLVAYFAFVIFGFSIDDQFIAVVLALLGHSLNATIVVFDRIRENRRMLGEEIPIAEVAERSVNESMGRTIGTDLCVFIAMAVLAVVSAAYGITALLSFALPMMFGVASGCYSSLCISCTLWVTWRERLERRDAQDGDILPIFS